MRAEQILPDHADRIEAGATTIRKGTVGGFLVNVRVLTDPGASPAERATAEADLVDALPALRAIGLFDLLEVRDPALRAWIDARPAAAAAHARKST
ncbi:TPA: hypothetical protein QDA74_001165 [Burkholderia territorii]|uniref:hypothetical protein n=1 Tax=Burkholderia territorii TaxID=1503055 RepID=UPI0011C8BFD4|nr:hypothetical protein [Burkholderia territorii]TXG10170.1 hypothetical protein FU139_22255 [Burkholderia territorii]HDR8857069.1 hypothetical protein [Burkholderia territorii]HDR8863006.1 hypothetical protein [Burkholderia territorii]HDR8869286.1 hypothetical protein [Burkholderia territorii]HDR8875720.1 hypothetical protein [Burkholderia territorii]